MILLLFLLFSLQAPYVFSMNPRRQKSPPRSASPTRKNRPLPTPPHNPARALALLRLRLLTLAHLVNKQSATTAPTNPANLPPPPPGMQPPPPGHSAAGAGGKPPKKDLLSEIQAGIILKKTDAAAQENKPKPTGGLLDAVRNAMFGRRKDIEPEESSDDWDS